MTPSSETAVVAGVDPGATIGWAVVRIPRHWLGGVIVRRELAEVLGCGATRDPGDAVGMLSRRGVERAWVERASGGAYGLARVGALLDSAWLGGWLAATLEQHVPLVIGVRAGDWRTVVAGRPSATDAMVAQALTSWVVLPQRSNAHVRDAIGCAIGGAIIGRRAT